MRRLRDFCRNQAGAAAAEMALVLPGFLFLLLGGSNLILVTYAKSIYKGPGIKNLTFTYVQTGTCGSSGGNGNLLTSTGSYRLFYGIGNLSITMNSKACFP